MRSASALHFRLVFFAPTSHRKQTIHRAPKGCKIPMIIQNILYRFFYIYVNLNILASIPYTAMLPAILERQKSPFSKMVR